MKESQFFQPIKEEIEKKKKPAKIQPPTSPESEETEQEPITLEDHWLSLRQSLQEKLNSQEPTTEEQEKTKLLSDLITPELMSGYRQILETFNIKRKKTAEKSSREFIDINDVELSSDIEEWIKNLVEEIKSKKEYGLDEKDIAELEAQCWLFFNSLSNVLNTKSLEKDVLDFYQDKKIEELDEKGQQKQKAELAKELQSRYPLDQAEIEILLDLVSPDKGAEENYNPRILLNNIARLWSEYKLNEKKGTVAKISLGYLLSKGLTSFAPSLFQHIIAQDKFNLAVFLEFFGLYKASEIIDAKTNIELAKVMNEINHQINERITNSLFFQEFEFIHEKSLGEIFAILERGKNSTERIIKETISSLVPTSAGILMSLGFLMKINPALGAIGLGSLPIMFRIAKKQNKQIWPMYEKEKREGEKISTRLGSIKDGIEEVRTSSETPTVAHHVKEQMDTRDNLSAQRFIEEAKMGLKRMIPFNVSTIAAAGVGAAFQEAGIISGGAVLSNIIYANQLNGPVQELVNLYFNKFSRYLQDIKRMDEILGSYEKLDLPEGEKEKDRIPVSELENFDISIKNLSYKNILHGVSLDIKQGEFLTLSGASGAGKSTLLRNLVGLYKPDGGEIEIGGVKNDKIKKYGTESIYSIMSYCNQNPQIFEGMTLRENLLLWSKEGADDEKIKKVLADLHLDKFIDRLDEEIKNLSGGEKVRIGVARTLIKGAKIMLLDEPTASLDSQAGTEVIKIISEINEKYPDTTIICVSHDEGLIKSSKRSVNVSDLQT
jgi:ABC-type multidrug transport system fused ATPase/permease subunit